MTTQLAELNPVRHRGYTWDQETQLYYLQSRYYNVEILRFIGPDRIQSSISVLHSIEDGNIYVYCANSPLNKIDSDGEFWLTKFIVGVTKQYVTDVVVNVISGKKGVEIFKPTSSVSDYLASGVSELIPGNGIGSTLLRNTIAEGLSIAEKAIKGEEIDIVDSLINIGVNTSVDLGFSIMGDKVDNTIESKRPKNYSTYAHAVRQTKPDLSVNQIRVRMQKKVRVCAHVKNTANCVIDVANSATNRLIME